MGLSTQTVPDVPGMVEESPMSVSFKPPPRNVCKVEGDVDIEKYDLPQVDANLEWWYFNAHVKSKGGRHFSMFASFFRRPLDVTSEDPERDFCDTCTWALVDVEGQQYLPDSLLDYRSCDIIAQKLDPQISGKPCQHAEGPLLKMVKQKRLPRPDRLMKGAALVAKDKLSLDLDTECTLKKRPVTSDEAKMQTSHAPAVAYEVKNKNSAKNCSSELTFLPQQSVVLHGVDGMVNNMFYYYIPRCSVKGSIFLDGEEHEVEGDGWYDREFGGSKDDTGTNALDAWTWFSVQLSNKSELSVYHIFDKDTRDAKEKVAVYTDGSGKRQVLEVELRPRGSWTSMSSFIEYPTEWDILVPSLDLKLTLTAAFAHQEFNTVLVTGGGFFEGRMHAEGTQGGEAVTGVGFLERKNFMLYKDTAGLLKHVGRFVRNTLAKLYPLPEDDVERDLQSFVEHYALGRHCTGRGVNASQLCEVLFRPVRALIDRGGKAWRSLILVSSMSALSSKYIDTSKYIALAELLHVGSLIIDDIQDESTVRRGGNCVHNDFGMATAINAGTACYFMAPILAGIDDLSQEKQLKIYSLYFDILRCGHAGQGLDILGLDHMMMQAVETGETQGLLDALRAIHVYKTGGPAGTLCRLASVIADAEEVQAKAMENYGTQIGLAFQIVDDALNLRGFEGGLKEDAEDIREGKITYPIILALGKLGFNDRVAIYEVLKEKTSDKDKIRDVISLLNSVNAIQDCLLEARNLVEEAWARLDEVLEDSLPKIMIRCFADYLTERTY